MKKIIMIVLSLVLILGLVACDKDSDNTYSFKIPTIVAYANWSPNESELLRECLNSETMTISSVRHLPIFKFETKTELDEFKNKYKDDFTMDQGYDGNPSFNEVTGNYDDNFFKDHTLILAYISAGSGSFRYGVSEVTKENGTLMMKVTQLNDPEVYTDDMSGWFLMAEVTKEYLKDCTKFDAQFVKDINRIIITTNEIEESNQASFELSKEKSDALKFMVTNTTNWTKETCDGLPDYTFEIDNNKYGIEIYSNQIHIVDRSNGRGEAVFTGDEYSEIEIILKDILDSRLDKEVATEDTIIISNGKNENELHHINRITKFVENAQNGVEDEIKIIQYTVEGDPITKDIRYNSSNGTFEIMTDTTQDKFGEQEVYNNVYDSSYKAEAGEIQINGENYYDFKLVSGENEVSICRFMYKHSGKNNDFISNMF